MTASPPASRVIVAGPFTAMRSIFARGLHRRRCAALYVFDRALDGVGVKIAPPAWLMLRKEKFLRAPEAAAARLFQSQDILTRAVTARYPPR
jgi:hypothetical protein